MVYELRDDVSVAPTDYGLVLLDGRDGEYWTLNPTGAAVIRTLLAGGDPGQAAQVLVQDFDTDLATATEDVTELVAELEAAQLFKERR